MRLHGIRGKDVEARAMNLLLEFRTVLEHVMYAGALGAIGDKDADDGDNYCTHK